MIFILLITYHCNNKSPLTHPDDPHSKYYINAFVVSDTIIRENINSATLYWKPDSLDKNIHKFRIYRRKTNSEYQKRYERKCTEINKIKSGSDSLYTFTDTTLQFETSYKYKICSLNEKKKESSKYDTLSYYHGFIRPGDKAEFIQLSDISSSINIDITDPLADSMQIVWCSGEDSVLKNCAPGTGGFQLDFLSGTNILDDNKFRIKYGILIDYKWIWADVWSLDTVIHFPQVDSLIGVRFDQVYTRLTWKYNRGSKFVKPDSFIIFRKTNDNWNRIAITPEYQNILSEKFYVYYENSIESTEYKIQPVTRYHQGIESDSILVDILNQNFDNYYWVDQEIPASDNLTGFYISKYEVSNTKFSDWIQEKDSIKNKFGIENTDLDVNFEPQVGFENKPVRGVAYDIAQEYAKDNRGRLPTDEEWELAASASQPNNESRAYPWGDDYPFKEYANYNYLYSSTLPVDSLEQGRVLINSSFQIFGAYHMAGNVMEWVVDSTSCYTNLLRKTTSDWRNCKGGSWQSDIEFIQIRSDYCMPVDISDKRIGFRLVKDMFY